MTELVAMPSCVRFKICLHC